ncbi:MAG: hypothetical protein AB7S68_02790 [Polyangiaceae bacterium]
MATRWSVGFFLLVGLGLTSFGACNIYNEKLLDPDPRYDGGVAASGGSGGNGGSGGVGGGAGGSDCLAGKCWWSTETAEGCADHRAPTVNDRPAATGGNDLPPFYLAIDHLWLGQTAPGDYPSGAEPWQYFGLDLDGVCTNSPDCSKGEKNVVSCRAGIGVPPDGLGCRDNMFARLEPVAADQPTLGEPFGISEDSFNCELHRGSFTILIKVTGYNGEPNDDNIRLDFYMSPGVDRDQSWECPEQGWDQRAPWLASFPWKVDKAMLQGTASGSDLPNSTLADPDAYVRDGYLVGDLPDGAQMRFIGDNANAAGFPLKFYKGIFVARPELGNDGLWTAYDGLLAGRVRQADMLTAFNQIGFCEGGDLPDGNGKVAAADANLLIDYLRVNMDVMSTGEVNPSADCDSMSVGIAFTARQATPGPAVDVSPLTECPMGGTPSAL